MKVAFFEIQGWEKPLLKKGLKNHSLSFFEEPLNSRNYQKAKNASAISVFVYSRIDSEVISKLPKLKLITTRSTGFDHIDVKECKKRKITLTNVPVYGENTVAEHTFALLLSLSRKVHKAYTRALKNYFGTDGLEGFDLKGKTIGVVGAGCIGKHVVRIARGFEMNVLVNDKHRDPFLAEQMNFEYCSFEQLLKKSDIVSLHIPYCKENHHLINRKTLKLFKKGAILINTSRGALCDTEALLESLDNGTLSGAGLDVIEGERFIIEEKQLLYEKNKDDAIKTFFEDHRLIDNEKVVYTPHIAFYSKEALERIINKTVSNINACAKGACERDTIIC